MPAIGPSKEVSAPSKSPKAVSTCICVHRQQKFEVTSMVRSDVRPESQTERLLIATPVDKKDLLFDTLGACGVSFAASTISSD